MVRRSRRLRDKAIELKGDVVTLTSSEKDESEDLEGLVKQAYAVIKEKVENDNGGFVSTDIGEEEMELTGQKDRISLSTKVKAKVSELHELASELNPGFDSNDMYFKMNERNSKPIVSAKINKLKFNDKEIMKKSVITPDFEKKETAPARVSYNALRKQKKIEREKSAGSDWFNMPAPEMTPELRRDLNIIKMRGVLDPKRHYKKNNSNKLPKYFQIGTVVSGPADFYSSRIPKRERKTTIVESLLADAEFRRYNKKKFLEIQAAKQAGGRKGFYKRFRKKRR